MNKADTLRKINKMEAFADSIKSIATGLRSDLTQGVSTPRSLKKSALSQEQMCNILAKRKQRLSK